MGETLSEMGPAGVTGKTQVPGLGLAAWACVGHVGKERYQKPSFQGKKGGLETRGVLPPSDARTRAWAQIHGNSPTWDPHSNLAGAHISSALG